MEGLGPEGETPRELFADKPRVPTPAVLADLAEQAAQRARSKVARDKRLTTRDTNATTVQA